MTHGALLSRGVLALVLGLAGSLAARDASAACTGVGLFSCSATVSVPLPMAFGNYNPGSGTAKDSSTAINVVGTISGLGILVNLSYSIALSAGTGGSIASRQLNGPSSTPLFYNLYTDAARSAVWGNGTVTDSYNALASVGGTSVSRSYTAYGRIPTGQYAAPGSYSNTITVTVNY